MIEVDAKELANIIRRTRKRHCRNCLRNCGSEYNYDNDLDANGDKINHNCWFKSEKEYNDNFAVNCNEFILNRSDK